MDCQFLCLATLFTDIAIKNRNSFDESAKFLVLRFSFYLNLKKSYFCIMAKSDGRSTEK